MVTFPGHRLRHGAVHELLCPPQFPPPQALALFLAAQCREGAIVWSDSLRRFYPPAAAGVGLGRLIILRCANRAQEMWALIECLRCPGVAATVASIQDLSRLEARRLQLAAERGGGMGIFLRPVIAHAHYAAATRWLVCPTPTADPDVQCWKVQLLHGRGEGFSWELDRETGAVRTSSPVADRPAVPAAARATA